MKILVCDDESIMRELHIGLLLEHGIHYEDIIEASGGKEALKIMEENDIALLLVDWSMPDLSGVELVKTIRKMKKYEETPIVMITAEGGRHSIAGAIQAGVTNYIIKPIQADLFWVKVQPYVEDFLTS
jgi:two-component system chemotaxis response regulator CheY